jgi:hypothetical protein
MKKILFAGVIIGACAALFHTGLPYTTLYHADQVIQTKDRSQIKALVKEHFELVQLKADIKDFMFRFGSVEIDKMQKDLAGNPFSGIGVGLAKVMLPTIIDSFLNEISPDYVTDGIISRAKSTNCRVEPISFGNAKYICVDPKTGKDVIALLAKSIGFTWKVVGMEIIDEQQFYKSIKK